MGPLRQVFKEGTKTEYQESDPYTKSSRKAKEKTPTTVDRINPALPSGPQTTGIMAYSLLFLTGNIIHRTMPVGLQDEKAERMAALGHRVDSGSSGFRALGAQGFVLRVWGLGTSGLRGLGV